MHYRFSPESPLDIYLSHALIAGSLPPSRSTHAWPFQPEWCAPGLHKWHNHGAGPPTHPRGHPPAHIDTDQHGPNELCLAAAASGSGHRSWYGHGPASTLAGLHWQWGLLRQHGATESGPRHVDRG